MYSVVNLRKHLTNAMHWHDALNNHTRSPVSCVFSNMGSLNFDCPLCCNESFSSQQSLRYHLLSIIDNLRCSICTKRFDSIYELAKHLDGECVIKAGNSNVNEEVNIKIEVEDSNSDEIGNSILAKALLSPKKGNAKSKNADDEDEDDIEHGGEVEQFGEEPEQDVYSCSSCGVSFTSVEEHIQKYHQGQEVVVEVSTIPVGPSSYTEP